MLPILDEAIEGSGRETKTGARGPLLRTCGRRDRSHHEEGVTERVQQIERHDRRGTPDKHTEAPTVDTLAAGLRTTRDDVIAALRALADEHCLVVQPGGESLWMAHPFSAVPTEHVVSIGDRHWFGNCAWDGLSVLALFGDGQLRTRSPATGEPIAFDVVNGRVTGDGVIHFLVPAARFWEDIGYT